MNLEDKSLEELMGDYEAELAEAKSKFESYQEYAPTVREFEYLGYDDQNMKLHSYRGTMNAYYDEYCDAIDSASEIRSFIEKKIQNKPQDKFTEIIDELEMIAENYDI